MGGDGEKKTSEGTRHGGSESGQSRHRDLPNVPPQSNYPLYVGKYDYDSRTDDDLSFRKGDLMYIISTEEGDWWYARHKTNGQEGYVPSNYIAEWKSLEAEE
jgi:hypothetical protein